MLFVFDLFMCFRLYVLCFLVSCVRCCVFCDLCYVYLSCACCGVRDCVLCVWVFVCVRVMYLVSLTVCEFCVKESVLEKYKLMCIHMYCVLPDVLLSVYCIVLYVFVVRCLSIVYVDVFVDEVVSNCVVFLFVIV